MKFVFISAMTEELAPLLKSFSSKKVDVINNQEIYYYEGENQYYFLNCGIGKVNAAITTSIFLEKYAVDYVFSIGTAGGVSSKLEILDLVLADKIAYHDVDVTGFGYQKGQVPKQDLYFNVNSSDAVKQLLTDSKIKYHTGLILSGDQFIDNQEKRDVITNSFTDVYALEMESAAIAHVCNNLNKKVTVVRAISDLAHGNSSMEFNEYLDIATKKYVEIINCLEAKDYQL